MFSNSQTSALPSTALLSPTPTLLPQAATLAAPVTRRMVKLKARRKPDVSLSAKKLDEVQRNIADAAKSLNEAVEHYIKQFRKDRVIINRILQEIMQAFSYGDLLEGTENDLIESISVAITGLEQEKQESNQSLGPGLIQCLAKLVYQFMVIGQSPFALLQFNDIGTLSAQLSKNQLLLDHTIAGLKDNDKKLLDSLSSPVVTNKDEIKITIPPGPQQLDKIAKAAEAFFLNASPAHVVIETGNEETAMSVLQTALEVTNRRGFFASVELKPGVKVSTDLEDFMGLRETLAKKCMPLACNNEAILKHIVSQTNQEELIGTFLGILLWKKDDTNQNKIAATLMILMMNIHDVDDNTVASFIQTMGNKCNKAVDKLMDDTLRFMPRDCADKAMQVYGKFLNATNMPLSATT